MRRGLVCEVDASAAGLAWWTTRPIIGVDPSPDDRHEGLITPDNLQCVDGSGNPAAERSGTAPVAIDTSSASLASSELVW